MPVLCPAGLRFELGNQWSLYVREMMKPKLIKTGKDYQAALARLDEIFEAQPGTADGDEAELLTTLIEMYEDQKYPIYRMEQED